MGEDAVEILRDKRNNVSDDLQLTGMFLFVMIFIHLQTEWTEC